MRRFILCLGMLLAWPLVGQAAKTAEPTVVDFSAGAWVDVDATGKAHVVEMDRLSQFKDEDKPGSIADIIKARLRDRIESWEFQPAVKNGATVPGKTFLHVSLEAFNQDGGMGIRVLSAATGGKLVDNRMGALQSALMKTGEEGMMKVSVSWGPDGTVGEVNLVDAAGFSKERRTGTLAPAGLVKLAVTVVKAWRFEPEIVGGEPVSGKGMVPISFCFEGDSCSFETASDKQATSPRFTAIDPAVQLRTAIAGTVL